MAAKGHEEHLYRLWSTEGGVEGLLWLWAQIVVVEQENQGRSGAILIEGVLFVLHFEWDFPNVNDT